jgi:succinate dehydrogenase/fumarate reductase-like Fe-S protein
VVSGRALALVVLAWSLIKVLVGRLFGRKTGLPLFHENYDADGLPALDAAERERMPKFERCIACGRCDVGEAERIAASRGRYAGLMPIVLASTRNMPDYAAAVEALAFIPESELVRKEKVCPTGVPFVELAQFVRSKAQATQGHSEQLVHE